LPVLFHEVGQPDFGAFGNDYRQWLVGRSRGRVLENGSLFVSGVETRSVELDGGCPVDANHDFATLAGGGEVLGVNADGLGAGSPTLAFVVVNRNFQTSSFLQLQPWQCFCFSWRKTFSN